MGIQIYCDGGSRGNPGPAACAFLVIKDGDIIYSKGKFLGMATNNIAEYSAVISALGWVNDNKKTMAGVVMFYLDSELVVRQLTGVYRVKEKTLLKLFLEAKEMERKFGKKIIFNHVLRSKNAEADLLVNKTLDDYHVSVPKK